MSKPNDPVFAVGCGKHDISECGCYAGITTREYFAGMAMQGILSCGSIASDELIATTSVGVADALIAELNRQIQSK